MEENDFPERNHFIIPANKCPHCGNKRAAAVYHDFNPVPTPDRLGICPVCVKWVKFDEHLQQVKLSEDELRSVGEDSKLVNLWLRVRQARLEIIEKN